MYISLCMCLNNLRAQLWGGNPAVFVRDLTEEEVSAGTFCPFYSPLGPVRHFSKHFFVYISFVFLPSILCHPIHRLFDMDQIIVFLRRSVGFRRKPSSIPMWPILMLSNFFLTVRHTSRPSSWSDECDPNFLNKAESTQEEAGLAMRQNDISMSVCWSWSDDSKNKNNKTQTQAQTPKPKNKN